MSSPVSRSKPSSSEVVRFQSAGFPGRGTCRRPASRVKSVATFKVRFRKSRIRIVSSVECEFQDRFRFLYFKSHVQSESSISIPVRVAVRVRIPSSSPGPKRNNPIAHQPSTIEVKIMSQCKLKSSSKPRLHDETRKKEKGKGKKRKEVRLATHGEIHIMPPLLCALPAQIRSNPRRKMKDERCKEIGGKEKASAIALYTSTSSTGS